MSLLIDGYNLLYVVGIARPKGGVGSLERSRMALLNFLAASLTPQDLPQTTVVFDAHQSPPGMPAVMEHHGLKVRFAAKYDDADSLIEELIRQESAPRRLTVVSSDHRLQKAARRRRARAVDSDAWYAEVTRERRARQKAMPPGAERPAVPLLEEDVNYWVRQFGGEAAIERWLVEPGNDTGFASDSPPRVTGATSVPPRGTGSASVSSAPDTGEASVTRPDDDRSGTDKLTDLDNPFPPGYGEDLLRDEDL
jgi:uncharacterized protein